MEQKLSFLKNMKKTDKYLILLGVGILVVVLSWPSGSDSAKQSVPDGEKNPTSETVPAENYEERIESRLEEILSRAVGAGKVEVMVTLKSSEEKIVQEDTSLSTKKSEETDSSGASRKQEEITEGRDTFTFGSGEDPYVRKELAPEIEGILVLADGADRATVKAEIVDAVQALFPLPAHKIKVLKRGS